MTLEKLANLPKWAYTLTGSLFGALIALGSWHGRFWGLASLAAMFCLVFAALWLAETE